MVEFDDNLNPIKPEDQGSAPQSNPTPTEPMPSWTPPTPPVPAAPVRPGMPVPPRRLVPANGMLVLVSLIILLAILAGGFYLFKNYQAPKPSTNTSGQQEGLSVSAEGLVYATPDIAKLSFGVQYSGRDAATVEAEVAKKITAIKAKLSELGVEDKDIKTIEFGIYPDYGNVVPSATTKPRAYNGRHILEATIRDLSKANDIAKAVVTAGANEVQNIQFTVEDPESWYQQARTQAITKAKEKAKQLAKDADIKLGRLISINEYSNGGPIYYDKSIAPGYGGGTGGAEVSTGVEPGSLELRANVTLIYEIR